MNHEDKCKNEEKNLLTEFQGSESFPSRFPIGNFSIIASERICRDNDGRALLSATINWQPRGTFTFTGIRFPNAVPFLFSLPVVFRIWRGSPEIPGNIPIYSTTDTSPIFTFNVLGTGAAGVTLVGGVLTLGTVVVSFSSVTTSFEFIDDLTRNQGEGGGDEIEYFLTFEVEADVQAALAIPAPAGSGITTIPITPDYVFTVAKISD
ncbi:hypothetical protein [Bacillus sp. MUM 13]|uniref:hypothetical protein n=1 Tax=Bacillus sp. MUM 13 TaxID=1678001 RepID=UPI0008F5EC9B|nr:hypothetical protein [Bacillus sp. MUM 13]OIK08566.1 hypothetical protein BIV59_19515 [Bacillus sp. MUM 13]